MRSQGEQFVVRNSGYAQSGEKIPMVLHGFHLRSKYYLSSEEQQAFLFLFDLITEKKSRVGLLSGSVVPCSSMKVVGSMMIMIYDYVYKRWKRSAKGAAEDESIEVKEQGRHFCENTGREEMQVAGALFWRDGGTWRKTS